jgi:hypothetical protein
MGARPVLSNTLVFAERGGLRVTMKIEEEGVNVAKD